MSELGRLLAEARRVWVLDGPNSGGRGGWLLSPDDTLRWFWQDGPPGEFGPPQSIERFLADHADDTDGRRAIVAWLRAEAGPPTDPSPM